jgi:hypothetical protein
MVDGFFQVYCVAGSQCSWQKQSMLECATKTDTGRRTSSNSFAPYTLRNPLLVLGAYEFQWFFLVNRWQKHNFRVFFIRICRESERERMRNRDNAREREIISLSFAF